MKFINKISLLLPNEGKTNTHTYVHMYTSTYTYICIYIILNNCQIDYSHIRGVRRARGSIR